MERSTLPAKALAGVVCCMALSVGCASSPASPPQASQSSHPAPAETPSASGSPTHQETTQVSTPASLSGDDATAAPMDSVHIDGILYDRGAYGQARVVPAGAVNLRSAVGRVESRVASYDLREGEATYLKPGAPLYAIEGYDPSFRLAARRDGGWALYEVTHNPGARKASELLDVGGKVESIGVEDTFEVEDTGPEEVAIIRGREEVGAIVGAALDAPLVRVSRGSLRYLVVFHLRDGTRSIRWYEPRSGELYLSENPSERDPYTGAVLPEAPREAIRRALPG